MHSFSVLIFESHLRYLVFTFVMPSSPEHLSDRCLSIFFYILLNSFQIWFTFSGGGSIPGRFFRGGLCGGNSMLQHRGELFKGVGVLTEKITNSIELKKDSTLPLKIGT